MSILYFYKGECLWSCESPIIPAQGTDVVIEKPDHARQHYEVASVIFSFRQIPGSGAGIDERVEVTLVKPLKP